MKKIKMTIAAAMFCAAAFAGYTAYEQTTMTDAEHMIQANLSALTNNEFDYSNGKPYVHTCGASTGSSNIFGNDNTCNVQVTDCQGGGSGCNEYKCPSHPTN